MKFMVIIDSEEVTVVTEDGGVACIRCAEDISDEPRLATTDYYQSRITQLENPTTDNVWELLAEGKMYANDWADKEYNNLELIQDALHWLCPTEKNWEMCDNLFPDIFEPDLN